MNRLFESARSLYHGGVGALASAASRVRAAVGLFLTAAFTCFGREAVANLAITATLAVTVGAGLPAALLAVSALRAAVVVLVIAFAFQALLRQPPRGHASAVGRGLRAAAAAAAVSWATACAAPGAKATTRPHPVVAVAVGSPAGAPARFARRLSPISAAYADGDPAPRRRPEPSPRRA